MARTQRFARPDAPAVDASASALEAPHATAARARSDAYANVSPANRGMVDALMAERRGYEQRGDMQERVALVNEQLRLRGFAA